MNNLNFLFMAVAKGQQSVEATEFKRYIGMGVCKVVCVNPNKAEIKEHMGYEPQEEPTYVGTQEIDGKNVPYARISFVVKTVPEKCNGIETAQMLSFFVRNQYRKGANSGKYQVIDEFGRTAWGEESVVKSNGKIYYKEGTMEANVTTNYRPAYVGEEALTDFIKTYLQIPNPSNYVNGSWVMKSAEEAKDSECRLDSIANYFKGDFSEIKDAIALQPDNKIQVLFGIRQTEDGREFQEVYAEKVLRSNDRRVENLQKAVEERQANGGLANRVYEFTPLHEYVVTPTDFSTPAEADDPFANASTEDTPW